MFLLVKIVRCDYFGYVGYRGSRLGRDLGVDDEDITAMTGHVDVTMIEYYDRGRRQRDATAARAVDDALRDAK